MKTKELEEVSSKYDAIQLEYESISDELFVLRNQYNELSLSFDGPVRLLPVKLPLDSIVYSVLRRTPAPSKMKPMKSVKMPTIHSTRNTTRF